MNRASSTTYTKVAIGSYGDDKRKDGCPSDTEVTLDSYKTLYATATGGGKSETGDIYSIYTGRRRTGKMYFGVHSSTSTPGGDTPQTGKDSILSSQEYLGKQYVLYANSIIDLRGTPFALQEGQTPWSSSGTEGETGTFQCTSSRQYCELQSVGAGASAAWHYKSSPTKGIVLDVLDSKAYADFLGKILFL